MDVKNIEKKKYYSADNLLYSCQYHVIFCPKYRRKVLKRKVLKNEYQPRLKEIFKKSC